MKDTKVLKTIDFDCEYADICKNYDCCWNVMSGNDNSEPNIETRAGVGVLNLTCYDFMDKEKKCK